MAVSGEHWAATLFGVLSFPNCGFFMFIYINPCSDRLSRTLPRPLSSNALVRVIGFGPLPTSSPSVRVIGFGPLPTSSPSISITLPDIPVSVFYSNTSTRATAIALAITEALYTSETRGISDDRCWFSPRLA